MTQPQELRIPVRDSELAVMCWPATQPQAPDAPVVVALHGITANALSWARVAHHLRGRVTLVAPEFRGRAGSADAPGPYGIPVHADDVAALAEAMGLRRIVLAGHSMGAFVAALAAVRHPDLVSRLLLVDGGVGFPPPKAVDSDELITAVLGPAMARLSMTFPDRSAYRDFWQRHPALAGSWASWVDDYIQRDLVGTEPDMHSSCRIDAVRTDGMGLFDAEVLEAVHRLPCPAALLWAERGLMDEPQGLYSEQRLDEARLDRDRIVTHRILGMNHYTVLLGDQGARTVAGHLLEAAGGSGAGPRSTNGTESAAG